MLNRFGPHLIAVLFILSSLVWNVGIAESPPTAWGLVFDFLGLVAILVAVYELIKSVRAPNIKLQIVNFLGPGSQMQTDGPIVGGSVKSTWKEEGTLKEPLRRAALYSFRFSLSAHNTGEIAARNIKASILLLAPENDPIIQLRPNLPSLSLEKVPVGLHWTPNEDRHSRFVVRSETDFLIFSQMLGEQAHPEDLEELGQFELEIPSLTGNEENCKVTLRVTFQAENFRRITQYFEFVPNWDLAQNPQYG